MDQRRKILLFVPRTLKSLFSNRKVAPAAFSGETLGFRAGRFLFFVLDHGRTARRIVRQFFRSPRSGLQYARYRFYVRKRDWEKVLRAAERLATTGEQLRDGRLMEEMGIALTRLGQYGRGGKLRLDSKRLRKGFPANEWRGEDISEKTLLLDLADDDGGATLGLVVQAAAKAKRCIVLTKEAPDLFQQRSLPGVDFRVASDEARAEADVYASSRHLIAFLGATFEEIEAGFLPLTPDPALVGAFRVKYGASGKPLVGIAWGSAAYGKDMPPLSAWSRLFSAVDADYVSLQYGSVEHDLETLRKGHSRTIIHDETVDQLVDMTRFAAQIAALDAVVTISNTGAHVTGSLGVPGIVIIDDLFRRAWPVTCDRTPWYPRLVIAGKKGRVWEEVMDEAAIKLAKLLAQKAAVNIS